MNYKIEGSGETLVFIHGLSDSLLYWEVLAAPLKGDFQVLRMDLRGHGESELGDGEITIGTYVDDIHDLLKDLNISDVTLIGFSLGGAVALDFAIKYPQMVSSLVLMSTFYKADSRLQGILGQFKEALNTDFEDFYDLILPMVLCPSVIEANRDELESLKQISSKNANTEAYIRAVDVCSNFNVENDLSMINVPTLILAGRYDDISTLDMQKELNSKINGSKLIVFDDVRHNLLIGKNIEKIADIIKKENQ